MPIPISMVYMYVTFTVSNGANSAAVSDDKTDGKANTPQGDKENGNLKKFSFLQCKVYYPAAFHIFHHFSHHLPAALLIGALKRIFMPESDASTFFRRRSRRDVKSQDELNGEHYCFP